MNSMCGLRGSGLARVADNGDLCRRRMKTDPVSTPVEKGQFSDDNTCSHTKGNNGFFSQGLMPPDPLRRNR
jgi:hypothetical protein